MHASSFPDFHWSELLHLEQLTRAFLLPGSSDANRQPATPVAVIVGLLPLRRGKAGAQPQGKQDTGEEYEEAAESKTESWKTHTHTHTHGRHRTRQWAPVVATANRLQLQNLPADGSDATHIYLYIQQVSHACCVVHRRRAQLIGRDLPW